MRKDILGKVGLAAVVLLAPGGFVLGATLAFNHYRKRRGVAPANVEPVNDGTPPER